MDKEKAFQYFDNLINLVNQGKGVVKVVTGVQAETANQLPKLRHIYAKINFILYFNHVFAKEPMLYSIDHISFV